MRKAKPKTLRAVRPNIGIEIAYRKKLGALISEMSASYLWFLRAQYRDQPPVMAQDSPATAFQRELDRLSTQWLDKFNEAAPRLARWFAQAASRRSQLALRKILKESGITVEFKMTRAMKDVMDATVNENVGLIKSIPAEYHAQVQGLVMRSVTAGRDLGSLTQALRHRFGVTEKRAGLIAITQNNMMTSATMRVRQTEMGLDEAVWLHSTAGKEPRPTHLANNGKTFSLKTGWFDPDPKVRQFILPGQLIRCRCTWRPIVKGFS